jgi:hypothetical protein
MGANSTPRPVWRQSASIRQIEEAKVTSPALLSVIASPRWLRVVNSLFMEQVAQIFHSFEAADNADEEYYAKLSGSECVSILLDLIQAYRESHGQAAARFERVCRVAELARG